MNKKGMTLLELLVYIALAALLLTPVIMLMNSSSKNMARDASNTDLRVSGRDLLNVIYDDLKNTGFKLDPSNISVRHAAAYLSDSTGVPGEADRIADSSSFIPANSSPTKYYDKLTVLMGVLNSNGAWLRVDTIQYYVSTDSLLKRKVGNGPDLGQTLARNVAALKFRYSADLVDWYDFSGYVPGPGTLTADIVDDKVSAQYIKVIIVLKDNKRLAATKNQKIMIIDYEGVDDDIAIEDDSQALYERHEIVVPIPNNGLYP